MSQITKPRKTTFKHVESEWFNYQQTVKEIKALEESILYPFEENPDEPGIVKGANSVRKPGNPTEQITIRLTKHKRLNYLREVTSAIETVYNALPNHYKNLVHERYWKKNNQKTWESLSVDFNKSERQLRRWRNEIVLATIEILGWR